MGQAAFNTKAPESVGAKNNFEVKYVLTNADSDNFIEPSFEDFEIVEGPIVKKRTTMQFVGGESVPKITVTFTYTLQAKKKGQLQIPSASIVVDGETIKSEPRQITVTGKDGIKGKVKEETEISAPKVATKNRGITENDFYCTSSASRRQLYEQEYLVVTYSYHSKIGTDATHVNPNTRPSFSNFLAEEVEVHEDSLLATTRKDGELIRTGTALQYIISPQQSGTLTIPGVVFDCDLTQRDLEPTSLEEFFEGENFINVKTQRRTSDFTIDVLPLPQPKPNNFCGGVGRFSITQTIDTYSPKAGEVDTLRIIIKGIGNQKLIKAPAILFPSDFDTFDVKIVDNTQLTPNGLSGEIIFNYAFIPLNAGEYQIPCVTFCYFDPFSKEYVTLSSDSIIVNVEPSPNVGKINSEIRDIHLNTGSNLNSSSSFTWPGSFYYYIALLLFVCFGSGCIYAGNSYKRKHADPAKNRQMRARRTALHQLHLLKRNANKQSEADFYRLLSESFREFMASKFLTIENSLTNDTILNLLQAACIEEKQIEETKQLLTSIDYAQFAASNESGLQEQLLEEAISLINSLDKKIEIEIAHE